MSENGSYIEVASVEELPNKRAVFLANDDILEYFGVSEKDRDSIVESLLVLSQDKLSKELLEQSDMKRKVDISVDPKHNNRGVVLRLLMHTGTGKFHLMTYFGSAVDSSTPLAQGLVHALQVVILLRNQMFSKDEVPMKEHALM